MKILLIEPFFTGSHKQWAEGFKRHSSHDITLLTMSGHHWKWRMHGAAVTLSRKFLEMDEEFDLILASDMLDLSTFLALSRRKTYNIPCAIYFHENQLSYPGSKRDTDRVAKRDNHYAFINFSSALSADHCFFNSEYHRADFLSQLGPFLNAFPDHNEQNARLLIEEKSKILPLGLDLKAFDKHRMESEAESPVILWNHRWEFDKDPDSFFQALMKMSEKGLDFRLVVLGEQFKESPPIFDEARMKLEKHILHWGQVDDFSDYAQWLWKSDLLPVTSRQDFFGGSAVEAIYCNCVPLLPNRLAFPEHIPKNQHEVFLYEENEFSDKLEFMLKNPQKSEHLQEWVGKYNWESLIGIYDESMEKTKGHPNGQPF